MAIMPYLAMTAAEFHAVSPLPPKIGWMACHFSPYSTGISNLPEMLPEGSMMILNDMIPIHGHDPERIAGQLAACMEANRCMGLLLDFQQQSKELDAMANYLTNALPFPVACPNNSSGPVFVPPVPCNVPLQEYFTQWPNQEIWLEIGLSTLQLQLTEEGCQSLPFSGQKIPDRGHADEALHCHYHIELLEEEARFTLWRTKEDLQDLLEEADSLGIHTSVGLWQELG